jgi:hypothetical protein
MEAFASIVLLVIAMFVYAGFTAVTEKLDEIIERLPPQRHPGHTVAATDHRASISHHSEVETLASWGGRRVGCVPPSHRTGHRMPPLGSAPAERKRADHGNAGCRVMETGASVSVGMRGLHRTFGRVNRTTIGLPGTGLSYTPLALATAAPPPSIQWPQ